MIDVYLFVIYFLILYKNIKFMLLNENINFTPKSYNIINDCDDCIVIYVKYFDVI